MEISYTIDELKIVGVYGKDIYVLATNVFTEDDVEKPINAVLVFNKTKWVNLQKEYIDEKRDFCERYNHFCGDAIIISNCYEADGLMDIRIGDKIELLDTFVITDFMVDMEHG